jgi:PII-like signaling protein
VNQESLKLTLYFGERDRANGEFLADALLDVFAEHEFETSVLMRGAEGFGFKQHLRTQRLLSLSEDLPLVTVAVDTRDRITAAMGAITELTSDGLVTLERARMLTGRLGAVELPEDLHEASKLTVYCGRQERVNGKPAFVAVVDLLHRHGVAGATVLLGVDGTAHGERQRAKFFGRNADVPMMVMGVGAGERIARLLPELGQMLPRPLVTLERVRVCKRDGERLTEPRHLPDTDESGLPVWQKLLVFAGEQARFGGRPLYLELIRRLREAGAGGATALRGVWGFHGDHQPHGDRLFALRRHVPVLTVIVDDPASIRRWFAIVDEVTAETGLVTSELVPAARAVGDGNRRGTLSLARYFTAPG